MDKEKALRSLGIKHTEVGSLNSASLRKAFLKLALVHHPDKNNDLESKERAKVEFQELKEAYDYLVQVVVESGKARGEQERTETLYAIFTRALNGENVEAELYDLGIYRPPDMFGVDVDVAFDSRLKKKSEDWPSSSEGSILDPKEALREAFEAEGLDAEGNPLEGWARPTNVDLEDLC